MSHPRRILMIVLFACSSACSGGVKGVYQDELGTTEYDFRDGKRVFIKVLEVTVAADYTANGDNIIVVSPQGTVVLARQGDRLVGPSGQVFVRQSI